MRQWLLMSMLVLSVACARQPSAPAPASGLVPASIVVESFFQGSTRTVPLLFELDGQPVPYPNVEFITVPDVELAGLRFVPAGPLGAPALLIVGAAEAGEYRALLRVDANGRLFEVPVTMVVKAPLKCREATACQISEFQLAAEACVDINQPDGTPCVLGCQTPAACHQGSCAPSMVVDAVTSCRTGEKGAVLEPVWRRPLPKGDLWDSASIDDDGNLYFVDRSRFAPNGPGDLISLAADGTERWRVLANNLGNVSYTPAQGAVVGAYVVITDSANWPPFQVRRRQTGELVWSHDRPVLRFAASRVNRLTLLRRDPTWSQQLEISDVALNTGVEIGFARVISPPNTEIDVASMVTDGNGRFIASTPSEATIIGRAIEGQTQFNLPEFDLHSRRLQAVTLKGALTKGLGTFISMQGGVQASRLPDVAEVSEAVVNEAGILYAVTQLAEDRCEPVQRLQRFDFDGVGRLTSCDVDAYRVIELAPTTTGGVAVLTESLTESSVDLYLYDAHLRFLQRITLLDGLTSPYVQHQFAALQGGRVLLTVVDGEGQLSLAAYDVPTLNIPQHGWLGRDGGPKRNGMAQ